MAATDRSSIHPPFYRGTWRPRRTCWSTPPPPPSPAAPLPPSWSSSSSAGRATGPRSSRTAGSPAPTSPGWRCSARFSPPPELQERRRRFRRPGSSFSHRSTSCFYSSGVTHTCSRQFPLAPWWSVPPEHEPLNPGLISGCGLKTHTHTHTHRKVSKTGGKINLTNISIWHLRDTQYIFQADKILINFFFKIQRCFLQYFLTFTDNNCLNHLDSVVSKLTKFRFRL